MLNLSMVLPRTEAGTPVTPDELIAKNALILDVFRIRNNIPDAGTFSEENLKKAAQGLAVFADVYAAGSDNLKRYMETNTQLLSLFMGFSPTLHLSRHETSVGDALISDSAATNDAYLAAIAEMKEHLSNAAAPLQIHDTAYPTDTGRPIYFQTIYNETALNRVAAENQDLFDVPTGQSITEWLVANPSLWLSSDQLPVGDPSYSQNTIRYGIVSGAPRDAAQDFVAQKLGQPRAATSEVPQPISNVYTAKYAFERRMFNFLAFTSDQVDFQKCVDHFVGVARHHILKSIPLH